MMPRIPSGTLPVKTPRFQATKARLGHEVEDVDDDEVRDGEDDVADDPPAGNRLGWVERERGWVPPGGRWRRWWGGGGGTALMASPSGLWHRSPHRNGRRPKRGSLGRLWIRPSRPDGPLGHVSAHPASILTVARSSPRVVPRLTMTIGMPWVRAARTKRSPDITCRDEPRTTRASLLDELVARRRDSWARSRRRTRHRA